MPDIGQQTAVIQSHDVRMDDKKQLYLNVVLRFADQKTIPSRIYVTKRSAGIARAKFRVCGYTDPLDTEAEVSDALARLDSEPILVGHEVPTLVSENGKYLNAEILARTPVGEADIAKAARFLAEAKGGGAENGDDIPF